MKTIWLFICRFWVYLYTKCRWYKFWSKLYRWAWESQWSETKVATYAKMDLITAREKPDWWKADSWKQLFDAVSSPEYVEAVWSGAAPKPTEGFDCDEFAIYAVAAATKSLAMGVMTDPVMNPCLLSVTWMEKNGWTPNGHNVCLVSTKAMNRQFAFIDYDKLSKWCDTIDEVAALVRSVYAEGSTPICHVVSALDLTPHSVGWAK